MAENREECMTSATYKLKLLRMREVKKDVQNTVQLKKSYQKNFKYLGAK